MKLFGKEIPVQKINFFTNIISFVLGVIFFIRMQYKMNEAPTMPLYNAERDSLIAIQARVNIQLREIKQVQDSVIQIIRENRLFLKEQEKSITVKRRQLYSTINSDWDNLSSESQNAYIEKIMSNLKPKQK
jgi:hypothetical protein